MVGEAETPVRGLRDALHVVWVLCLGAAVVVPALPEAWQGEAGKAITGYLRRLSVAQHWSMYAPNPQRGQAYLDLRARLADGSEEPLEESIQAKGGWDTKWAWEKTRIDIWRAHASLHTEGQGNPNRTWYAKAVCVREARRRGEAPQAILVDRVVRGFTAPDRVRAGAPDLGPVERTPIQKIDCRFPQIQAMLAADRQNHEGAG